MQVERAGAYAAIGEVVALLVLLALYGVVLPQRGLDSPEAFYRADTLRHAGVLGLIAALNAPLGIGVVVITLAIRQIVERHAPTLVSAAAIVGTMSATLLVASAGIGWRGLAELAAADSTTAGATWPALLTVYSGIETLGLFCLGGWLILVSAAAWNTASGLPKPVNVLGIVTGVLFVATVVVPTQPVSPVLLLGWFAWLAIRLFRHEPRSIADGAVVRGSL